MKPYSLFVSKIFDNPKVRIFIDWYEFIVDNTAALYLVFIFLSILNLVCFPLPIAKRVKNAYNYKLKQPENKEIVVFSAYFYDKGPKNGEVSLVFFGNREAKWEKRKFFIAGRNGTKSNSKKLKVHKATPHNMCEYVTFVGNDLLVENLKNLELIYEESIAQISFKMADSVPREVVVCTPPINERTSWRNVLEAVKIHRRFGAHVQVYFSRGTPTFIQFLQQLELEIDHFPSEYSNKLEFGGTTVANCDCLNKYKNSASFITFLEWDEILSIDDDTKSNYFDEFSKIFTFQPFIGIVVFEEPLEKREIIVTRPDLISTVWSGREGRRPYQMRRIYGRSSNVKLRVQNKSKGLEESSTTLFKKLDEEETFISKYCGREEDSDILNFQSQNSQFYKCLLLPKSCSSDFTLFLKFYCPNPNNSEYLKETKHFKILQRNFGKMEGVVKC